MRDLIEWRGVTFAGIGVPDEEEKHGVRVLTGELLWLASRTRPDIAHRLR